MEAFLQGLRAAAEPTRLRVLALCAQAELTVSELTQILGQSQPRVSRHLKLLVEAGLLDRFQEGTWAFYRLSERGNGAALGRLLVDLLPAADAALALDLERLDAVKRSRAAQAAAYFSANAAEWDRIRGLYVDDGEIEAALVACLGGGTYSALLDVGTGTGRVLEVLGGHVGRAVGIDNSRDMLSVARANLEQAGLRNCQVRQGDMYQLPVANAAFDAVTLHLVLHYAESPGEVIAECARALRPGGRIVIVDFAPHQEEVLRTEHAHRRLGFAEGEIRGWLDRAGLTAATPVRLSGDPLTVVLWSGDKPPGMHAPAPVTDADVQRVAAECEEEVAT